MQHLDDDEDKPTEAEALSSEDESESSLEDANSTSEAEFDLAPGDSPLPELDCDVDFENFSWDSENSIEILEQNKDAFRRQFICARKFFEPISCSVVDEAKDTETTICPTCLDLDWALYERHED